MWILVFGSTLLMPAFAWIITGFFKLPPTFQPKEDLFGWNLEAAQKKRSFWKYVLPLLGTVIFLFLPLPAANLRLLIAALFFPLAWRGATQDIEVTGEKRTLEKILCLSGPIFIFFSPSTLFILLYICFILLKLWEHHTYTLFRLLLYFLSVWFLSSYNPEILNSAFITGAIAFIALPYIKAGISKLRLSLKWPIENRIDLLPRAAWLWGFRPFSSKTTLRMSKALKPFSPLLQTLTIVFEVGFIAAFLHPWIAIAFLTSSLIFHTVIFVLCGVFFWQSILTNTFVTLFLLTNTLPIFGLHSELFFLLWVVLVWNLRAFFYTKSLAWWDTALINRIDWTVIGESGEKYSLGNDFLDPQERLFGQKLPYSLSCDPQLTTHMGECKSKSLAQRINSQINNPAALWSLINSEGIKRPPGNQIPLTKHYLNLLIKQVNENQKKSVCPSLIKAPLGQNFRSGALRNYVGQEKILEIKWSYRIEVFSDEGPQMLYQGEVQ